MVRGFAHACLTAAAVLTAVPGNAAEDPARWRERPQALHHPTVQALADGVDRAELVELLNVLSGGSPVNTTAGFRRLRSRNAFHADSAAAREFIVTWYRDQGLAAVTEPFAFTMDRAPYLTTTTANIVVELPGSENPDEVVAFGAHWDSIASFTDGFDPRVTPAPGADDNASGSAAVMHLAHAMSATPWRRTLRFILYGGEEYGLYGSRHDALAWDDDPRTLVALVNADMIAPEPGVNPERVVVFYEDDTMGAPPDIGWAMVAGARGHALARPVALLWAPVIPNSDHFPYWYGGQRAVFLNHASETDGYHTVADVAAETDMDYMTDVVRTIAVGLALTAGPPGDEPTASAGLDAAHDGDGDSELALGCGVATAGRGQPLLPLFVTLAVVAGARRRGRSAPIRKRGGAALAAAVAALVLLGGCENTLAPEEHLARGKDDLGRGDWTAAREAFGDFARQGGDGVTADFALALCDALEVVDLLNLGLNELTFLAPDPPPALRLAAGVPGWEDLSEGRRIGRFVHETAWKIAAMAARNRARLDRVAREPKFRFTLERLPLRLGPYALGIVFSGELDQGEVHLLQAGFAAFAALGTTIGAHDLDYEWTRLDQVRRIGGDLRPLLSAVIAAATDPAFPTLLNVTDVTAFRRGGAALGAAAAELATAWRTIAAETDDQKDDLFAADCDAAGCTAVLGGIVAHDDHGQLHELSVSLDDRYLGALDAIAANLSSGGPPLEFGTHLVPALEPLLRMAGAALGLGSVVETAIVLLTTVEDAWPRMFALDLGAFYANHTAIRDYLPAFAADGSSAAAFVLEWECVGLAPGSYPDGDYGLFCADDDGFADAPHFLDGSAAAAAGIAAIAADGWATTAPYVPWPDPTFSDLLWLDRTFFVADRDYADDLQPADNRTLNGAWILVADVLGAKSRQANRPTDP